MEKSEAKYFLQQPRLQTSLLHWGTQTHPTHTLDMHLCIANNKKYLRQRHDINIFFFLDGRTKEWMVGGGMDG